MKKKILGILFATFIAFLVLPSLNAQATIDLSGTTGWTSVYPLGAAYDAIGDQQTGSGTVSQDVVGDATYPCVYAASDGTYMAFRIRLNTMDMTTSPYSYTKFAFVGVDADLNGGIDFFIGIYKPTSSGKQIGIFDSDPSQTNTSPSTTGIKTALKTYTPVSGTNFYISKCTDSSFSSNYDYFISFKVPMADIATYTGFTVNSSTPLHYIAGTATQNNSFNQDIVGIGKTYTSTTSWADLGTYTPVIDATGAVVTHTVTFDKNGGTTDASPTSKTATYGSNVGSLPVAPTKTGYTFAGWNTVADGSGTAFTASTAVTADITVYAQWTINTYTVTFNKNGGTSEASPTSKTATYGGNVGTLPTAPTRTGSTFAGWNTEADGSGTAFTAATPVIADRTVFAQWTVNTYTVTFDKNGGTTDASPTTKTVTHGGNVGSLPTAPTKTGYTFTSWNTKADGTGNAFTAAIAITADITVYAQWTINTYTVTFDKNGGTTEASPTSKTATYGSNVGSLPTEPTRAGYTFNGWNTNNVGTGTTFTASTSVTADITVYAQWTLNSYTVTFNSNGGSIVADQTVAYNSTVTEPTAPTREGYTFGGWYSNAGLITAYDFDTVVTADLTLFAKWTAITYTASFNSNGGSIVADQTVAYSSTLTEPAAPTREGYTFGGWYSNAELTNAYGFYTVVTADLTLFAKWTAITYTASFNSNGGSSVADQTVAYNGTVTEPTAPTREGYTFGGWYGNAGLTTAYDFDTVVTADLTLFAKWTAITYTASFNSNGGSIVADQTVAYNNTLTEPAAPTREGYTFGGWYSNVGLTNAYDFDTVVTADLTLFAKWTAITYTASFNSNGGSSIADQTVAYNSTLTEPTAPTREGYTFGGWYSNVGLTNAYDFDTVVTADLTLFAKWTAITITYTVTFDKNGGTTDASPTTKTATSGDNVGSLPTEPTRDGYTFAGWNTVDDGSGTAFTATTAVTANVTVYAQWTAISSITYIVTFDKNGGTTDASPTTETATSGGNVGSLPTAPAKTGYTFTGWNTAADGSGSTFTDSTTVTADITVYAQWVLVPSSYVGGLHAEYYDTLAMNDSTYKLMHDQVIWPNFNYGGSSPDPVIDPETFSIVFTGYICPPEDGEYTFYTYSDDGVRLTIGSTTILDRLEDIDLEFTEGTPISMTGGSCYPLELDYFENHYNSTLFLFYSKDGADLALVPASWYYSDTTWTKTYYNNVSGAGTGLTMNYYNSSNPDFDSDTPVLTRQGKIFLEFLDGSPDSSINSDNFAALFEGYIESRYTEDLTLQFVVDDGLRVYIDDALVIDEWHGNSDAVYSYTFAAENNQKYKIRIEYCEYTGSATCCMFWYSGGSGKQTIPLKYLYPAD